MLNPNHSLACGAAIEAAIAGLRFPGGPVLEVASLAEGPAAIYDWGDWHAAVAPLCRRIRAEDEAADPPAAYVIACASDPGLEAARAATARPVLGLFRAAVAAALVRAERFGVIALVDASLARHAAALRAIGLHRRRARVVALNVTMDELLDPIAARARIAAAARDCVAAGAGVVILGCTGMAQHRRHAEQAAGVAVIEPCQAAAALAIAAVHEGGAIAPDAHGSRPGA